MFDKIRQKIAGKDFKFLDTTEAAKEFLTGEFPGSSVDSWKQKSLNEKEGMSIRAFEGPHKMKAAVIYNESAKEEKYALILDTTGNFDIDNYDPSKFVNETPKEKDPTDMTGIVKGTEEIPQEIKDQIEQKENEKVEEKKKPKLTKKEEKAIDDVMASHNLSVMNAIIELNENAEADKQKIIDALENMGATYVVIEDKRKFLAGSTEFGKDVTKNKTATALTIKCISTDANLIRMQLGEYISAIYRKI